MGPIIQNERLGSEQTDSLQAHYIGFENTVHLRMNPWYLSESD
jgi:hypothetical protein